MFFFQVLTDVFGPDDMDGKFKEWGCEEYELPGMPPSPPPPPGGDDELFSPPPGSPCRLDLDDGSPSLEKPYVREMEKTIEGSRFIAQHVKNKDKFESVSIWFPAFIYLTKYVNSYLMFNF